jgi:hypothetical protein
MFKYRKVWKCGIYFESMGVWREADKESRRQDRLARRVQH